MGTRPFKIFISLLDSWEIGTPLTEILILDALSAPATSSDPVNLADSESEVSPAFLCVWGQFGPNRERLD